METERTIRVIFYEPFRSLVGIRWLNVQIGSDTRLGEVIGRLQKDYPLLKQVLDGGDLTDQVLFIVDQQIADFETPVMSGQEIKILLPFSGG